jgi:hypothetical protein
MSLTYGLKTARDVLAKLRREHSRLLKEVTSDDFFNFVVTGYHLTDWIERDPTIPTAAKNDLASVRANSCIAACRDLTNASKHFELSKGYKNQAAASADATSGFGAGRFGAGAYGVGEESISIMLLNGIQYDALGFAQDVLKCWGTFFAKHAL